MMVEKKEVWSSRDYILLIHLVRYTPLRLRQYANQPKEWCKRQENRTDIPNQ
ncbi:hypothetical protein QG37_05741 [Candidozyma auris]|uniref:Uncharacterized protein n=1 Tax=Candidozyma auris TaxID=498019 RepID=A0A0L0NT66_CANAR|nr:hypothetical protein QG37_05741 [[Candida] auris]